MGRPAISLPFTCGVRENSVVAPWQCGYSQLNSDFLSLLGWDSFGEYPAWAHAPHSTQFNNTCCPELFSTSRTRALYVIQSFSESILHIIEEHETCCTFFFCSYINISYIDIVCKKSRNIYVIYAKGRRRNIFYKPSHQNVSAWVTLKGERYQRQSVADGHVVAATWYLEKHLCMRNLSTISRGIPSETVVTYRYQYHTSTTCQSEALRCVKRSFLFQDCGQSAIDRLIHVKYI